MSDLLQSFLVFVVLNIVLFSTANTLIWRYFDRELRDVFDWFILFFLLISAEVLFVLGVIGFMNQLNLLALSISVGICFLLVAVPLPFIGKSFRLGVLDAWGKLRHLLFRQDKGESKDWIWAVFGFLVLFGAIELFNAFVQFPWEYDTLAYHMPIVVEWIQSGSLWDVLYAVWGGPLGYYPSNHELMLSWLILPFGSDYLVNLANFWIVGVLVIVIYKIMKEMGVNDFLSWLCGALVMVMPIFLRQIGTGQVDTLMALGVVIAWYYFLRTYKRKDGLLLVPLLLNLAIMLGAKYLSIIYIIPILLVFIFLASYWRKSHPLWWVWTLGIMGTLGSMWYWRNLILTGNPIFPADVSIGGWTIFQGYMGLTERIQELSLWNRIIENGEYIKWFRAMTEETGWHLYLVGLAYILLVLEMLYKLLFSRMKHGEGKFYTLMLFFLPTYWYLYFITPYTASMMNHNVRYAMPWLMLSMIMVVYVVYKLQLFQRVFSVALMGVIWWQFLILVSSKRTGDQSFLDFRFVYIYPWSFFLLFLVILFFFLFFEVWRKRYWWRHGVLILSLVLSFFFFQQVVGIRSDMRAESWKYKYDFPIIDVYAWLDNNAAPDAVIANSFNPLYYPLYGESLQRRVRYVNINTCGKCDYYSYQHNGMTVRDNADYQAWHQNLIDFGVDYILLGYSIEDGLEGVRPYELEWVKEYSKDFNLEFEKDGVFLYSLRS